MFNFKPKEDIFFTLLIKLANTAYDASVLLNNYTHDSSNIDETINNILVIEKQSHSYKHEIIQRLQDTFITPYDREDIYAIMSTINKYINNVRSSVYRFKMYHIDEVLEPAKQISQCLVQSTEQLILLLENLRYKNKLPIVKDYIMKINHTEGIIDDIFRNAITDLFNYPDDILSIVKWTEIYQHLENTSDQCEEIADSVAIILTKNE